MQRTPEEKELIERANQVGERLENEIDPERETDVLARYRNWLEAHVDGKIEKDGGLPGAAFFEEENIEHFIEDAVEPTKWILGNRESSDVW